MDYEKKYKEALELATVAAFNGHQSLMEGIFPELKESEDEKIRKELIDFFQDWHKIKPSRLSVNVSDILAWLKKQGEKSLTVDIDSMMEAYEQRLINQGNGVRNSPIVNMCVAAFKHGAENTMDELHLKQGGPSIKWNKNTEDNKPQVNHSVLMQTTHGIAEGEWQGEYWEQYRWAGIVRDSDVLSWIELSDLDKQGEQKPADEVGNYDHKEVLQTIINEQKPLWSEEDDKMYNSLTEFEKAVKQVMEEAIECGDTHNLKADADMLLRLTQKPWSEKDEKILKAIHNSVDVECLSKNELDYVVMVDWFNALKDRVQPKQEWSEEDATHYNRILKELNLQKEMPINASVIKEVKSDIIWFKSLRPQNTWKPSDEQITVLELASKYERVFTPKQIDILIDLKEQLKKLRGE